MKALNVLPVLCCCVLGFLGSSHGQAEDQPPNQSEVQSPPADPGTHLMTMRLTGSFLLDSNATMAGHLEAVALDPGSSQVRFGMVSLGYPTDRVNVTPIPWGLVQHHYDARASGGMPGTFQRFIVPFDRATLARAPRVNTQLQGRTNDNAWIAASTAFFAALTSVGAAGNDSGVQTGGAASGPLTSADAVGTTGEVAPFFGGVGGVLPSTIGDFVALGTNLFGPDFLARFVGTNVTITNVSSTNVFSTNVLLALTNFFGTNVLQLTNANFANITNFFATNGLALTPFASNLLRNTNFAGAPNSGSGTNVSARALLSTNRSLFPPTNQLVPLNRFRTLGTQTRVSPARPQTTPSGPGIRGIPDSTTPGSPAPAPPPSGTEPIVPAPEMAPGAPAPTPPPSGVEPIAPGRAPGAPAPTPPPSGTERLPSPTPVPAPGPVTPGARPRQAPLVPAR